MRVVENQLYMSNQSSRERTQQEGGISEEILLRTD